MLGEPMAVDERRSGLRDRVSGHEGTLHVGSLLVESLAPTPARRERGPSDRQQAELTEMSQKRQ